MKLHHLIFCLGILLACLTSCCEEEEPMEEPDMEEEDMMNEVEDTSSTVFNCFGELFNSDFTCDNFINEKDSIYCDPIDLGSFKLSEVSENFADLFCGIDTIRFKNEDGKEIRFEISGQQYSFSRRVNYGTIKNCPEDSTKFSLHCYESDRFGLRFNSLDDYPSFNMSIESKTFYVGSLYGKYYDNVTISENITPTTFSRRLDVVLEGGDTGLDHIQLNENNDYKETLVLNGVEYKDVLVDLHEFNTAIIRSYYITRDKGLIAIKDIDGSIYSLVE